MAITYTWEFSQLDCYLSKNAKTNVVYTVHWRLQGVEGAYSEEIYGSASIDTSDLSNFIEFDNLTESDVEGWISNVSFLKTQISNLIENKKNPTTESKLPPWKNE